MSSAQLKIEHYSDASIAVFGDIFKVFNKLQELGGKYNPQLKVKNSKTDERRAGFIYSKSRAQVVSALESFINNPEEINKAIEEQESQENDNGKKKKTAAKKTNSDPQEQSTFDNALMSGILSRIEKLEIENANLKMIVAGLSDQYTKLTNKETVVVSSKNLVKRVLTKQQPSEPIDEEDFDDDEPEVVEKPTRLLRTKKN